MADKKPDLKIKGIKGTNIMGFDNIEVTFKDGHTRIYAPNKGGKTSLKKLIPQGFFGVSQTNRGGQLVGEKFRFIGKKGKASDTKITLKDVKGDFTVTISNHMTKDTNGIKIEASDGRELTKEWLLSYFNEAFFSAENFLSYTPKQQTELLGIKTDKYDENIKALKVLATEIRAAVKVIGEPEKLEKVERVDTYALGQEKDRIEAFNREQVERRDRQMHATITLGNKESEINDIKKALETAQDEMKAFREEQKKLPFAENEKLTDTINQQLENADETNRAAEAYERNEGKRIAKEATEKRLAKNLADQKKEQDKRTDYIKTFKLPMKGMTVDDKGGLLINDMPLSFFSQSEQIIIVAKLNASRKSGNMTVWIDKYESLDEENKKAIVKYLINKGYDVITAEVGSEKKGDGSILLNNCKVVGAETDEDDREELL